jgi:hypothetical protein
MTFYPDWPSEPLVALPPLPVCEGPKLDAFDFKGPQQIKFLQEVGVGSHGYVFKVEIHGKIYALKLVRISGLITTRELTMSSF